MTQEEYLVHYGVLGMKWGVRKDGKPQGYQGSGKGRRKGSSEAKSSTGKQIVTRAAASAGMHAVSGAVNAAVTKKVTEMVAGESLVNGKDIAKVAVSNATGAAVGNALVDVVVRKFRKTDYAEKSKGRQYLETALTSSAKMAVMQMVTSTVGGLMVGNPLPLASVVTTAAFKAAQAAGEGIVLKFIGEKIFKRKNVNPTTV